MIILFTLFQCDKTTNKTLNLIYQTFFFFIEKQPRGFHIPQTHASRQIAVSREQKTSKVKSH